MEKAVGRRRRVRLRRRLARLRRSKPRHLHRNRQRRHQSPRNCQVKDRHITRMSRFSCSTACPRVPLVSGIPSMHLSSRMGPRVVRVSPVYAWQYQRPTLLAELVAPVSESFSESQWNGCARNQIA